MTKFIVTLYSFEHSLIERIGGFTDRKEANEVAAKQFQRGDVGSVHVTEDSTSGGNGRYR